MDINEVVGILKQSMVFEGLSESELKKIGVGCVEQAFPMDTAVIEENDPPKNTLYFVKKGEMTVCTTNITEDGSNVSDEALITTLGAGDAFGEIAIVDQLPHSATVRTISDSIIFLLSASFIDSICEQHPHIGYIIYRNIAKLICRRLRSTNFSAKQFWGSDD